MKRWLLLGLLQGCVVAEVVTEEVTSGLQMTDEWVAEVSSRVVARCSFFVSMHIESRLTCAVLRGCRSFCTAAKGKGK